jgi:crotonobetainyl-CoA:carnitine CoA-transferase CaiB-like acyl-CoA transferase
VLEQHEITENAHNRARGTIAKIDSPQGPVTQIRVGPKLSETPGVPGAVGPEPGRDTDAVLRALGHDEDAIAALHASGTVG